MASDRQIRDFGATLRDARERRKLSLRAIADATRISVRALEALERNDVAHLPGGIFSRAFVRAYAVEVGLDPEQTVADFITRFPDDIVTQGHPRTRDLVAQLDRDGRRSGWVTVGRVAIVAVPIVMLLAYVGGVGRRTSLPVAAISVQPAAARADPAPPVLPRPSEAGAAAAAANVSMTVRALRATTINVTLDASAPALVDLNEGTSRTFEARRSIAVVPVDSSALEWTTRGFPLRGMNGPITVTPDTLLSIPSAR
jgi:cytoskeleton protein RodZ